MDEDEFFKTLENCFQDLHQPDAESFEKTHELQSHEDFELEVSGSRMDNDRWGEDRYALDANVKFSVEEEEDWEELEEELDRLTSRLKNLLQDTIGFTGPVVVRSNDDMCERMWARRLIHDIENEESDEESDEESE